MIQNKLGRYRHGPITVDLVSYYRRFIKNFSKMSAPLHELAQKGRRFPWNWKAGQAMQMLKTALLSTPLLEYPDFNETFIVLSTGR